MTLHCRIISDVHAEFFRNGGDPAVTEQLMEDAIPYLKDEQHMVLVIAGDFVHTACMKEYTPWVKDLAQRHLAVVYVMGNHEPYHGSRDEAIFYWKYIAATIKNLHVLENDCAIIDGVRFLGTSLYTSFDNPLDEPLINQMADMDLVKGMSLAAWKSIYMQAKVYLEQQLQDVVWGGKTVIVTHHAPSYQSFHSNYRGRNMNACYANHLENLIAYNDIALWCHGHIHDNSDYMIEDTRIVCNPNGYYNKYPNKDYNGALVVEV